MVIDFEELADSLSNYGIDFTPDDPYLNSKISQIVQQFNMSTERLEDEIVAFAQNTKKSVLEKNLIEAMEIKFQKQLETELKSAQNTKRPILVDKLQTSFNLNTSLADNDINMVEDDKNVVMNEIYASFAPVKSAAHSRYLARPNKNTVASEIQGPLFACNERPVSLRPQITVLSKEANSFYAGDKAANIIDEIACKLEEFSSLFRQHNPEITNWTHSTAAGSEVCIYGMVVKDSEEDSSNVTNLKLMLDDEAGTVISLDLSSLSSITIFPGQIVAYQGIFEVDKTFKVEKQFFLPQLPAKSVERRDSNFLTVWTACGPFTSSETCGYEPLYDLLDLVRKEQPNVLILMGPFVDKKNKYFLSPNAEATFSQIFNILMTRIVLFLDKCTTQVIIQPSPTRDATCISKFPTPPLDVPGEMLKNSGKRFFLVSDPAIVEIEGIHFSITGSEIVAQISRSEWHRSENQENVDRISRLCSHILDQRSLYPLNPPAIPSSLQDSLKLCKLTHAPHVIISPSVLPAAFKNINGTMFCNPGVLLRGNNGTYATMEVNLNVSNGTSIGDYTKARVMKI